MKRVIKVLIVCFALIGLFSVGGRKAVTAVQQSITLDFYDASTLTIDSTTVAADIAYFQNRVYNSNGEAGTPATKLPGSSYVTAYQATGGAVYQGRKGGIGLGTSSTKGQFKLTFNAEIVVTKVNLWAASWNTVATTIAVNSVASTGGSLINGGSPITSSPVVYQLTGANSKNTLEFIPSANRAVIHRIQIFYGEDIPSETPQSKFAALETKSSLMFAYIVDGKDFSIVDESAALRFGTVIDAELYDELLLAGAIVKFGVDIEGDITYATPVRVASPGAAVADPLGAYYQFAVVISEIGNEYLDFDLEAKTFVEIDNVKTYTLTEKYSVVSLAQAYLNAEDTSAYTEYLDVLRYLAAMA